MATEQQDKDNRHHESGLSGESLWGGDGGMKRRRGKRRATHQVETGQGCRSAGKDKDIACLVRQALSPSGRLVCGFIIHVWMPLWFVLFCDLLPLKKTFRLYQCTIIISVLAEVGTWGTYVEVHLIWVWKLICQTFSLSYNLWLWKNPLQHGVTWNSPPVLHWTTQELRVLRRKAL